VGRDADDRATRAAPVNLCALEDELLWAVRRREGGRLIELRPLLEGETTSRIARRGA
jgi:hypothetical protein